MMMRNNTSRLPFCLWLLLLFVVLLTLGGSVVGAATTTLRGGGDTTTMENSSSSSFSLKCTTAAADEDLCTSSKDDSGIPCVWCQWMTNDDVSGICVSSNQSKEISNIVPTDVLQCSSRPSHQQQDWDDDDNDTRRHPVDSNRGHDDDDESDEEQEEVSSPTDLTCIQAGIQQGADEDSCEATVDQDGNACVWCTAGGAAAAGLCLTSDQASMASQWLTCIDNDFDVVVAKDHGPAAAVDSMMIQSPTDLTCIQAGIQGDEDSCEATIDQDGDACVWCTAGGGAAGLCLTSDQASMASQWLTCNDDDFDVVDSMIQSPTDLTCLESGLQADEETCHSTVDQDGDACVWCTANEAGGAGLCLTSDQASMVSQWLACDDTYATNELVEVESRNDPTCDEAGLEEDEDLCHATVDQDGNACVWCTVGGAGLCLTSDEASAVSELLTCDNTATMNERAVEVDSPTDPTCVEAGLEGDEDICHATVDQDGDSCVWCTAGGAGLCLTSDQASMASQWMTCDGGSDNVNTDPPLDPTCVEAGLQGDEDTCHATIDQDGNACVWCDGGGGAGLCLTSDQASMASQWLTCESNENTVVETS